MRTTQDRKRKPFEATLCGLPHRALTKHAELLAVDMTRFIGHDAWTRRDQVILRGNTDRSDTDDGGGVVAFCRSGDSHGDPLTPRPADPSAASHSRPTVSVIATTDDTIATRSPLPARSAQIEHSPPATRTRSVRRAPARVDVGECDLGSLRW